MPSLSDVLEGLWREALTERYKINGHSNVALLDHALPSLRIHGQDRSNQ